MQEGRDDKLKTDLQLLEGAERIEKIEKNLKYGGDGKLKDGCAKNKDQKRHEEIVQELNSRGMFHKSQTLDDSLAQYQINDSQAANADNP